MSGVQEETFKVSGGLMIKTYGSVRIAKAISGKDKITIHSSTDTA